VIFKNYCDSTIFVTLNYFLICFSVQQMVILRFIFCYVQDFTEFYLYVINVCVRQ